MLKLFYQKTLKLLRITAEKVIIPTTLLLSAPFRKNREQKFFSKVSPQTILISYFGRGIGDCIYFSSLLPNIRSHYPNAILELAVLRQMAPYFKGIPYVDNIILVDDYMGPLGSYKKFLSSSFTLREQRVFDLLLNLAATPFFQPGLWDLFVKSKFSLGIGNGLKRLCYDVTLPIRWEQPFLVNMAEGLKYLQIECQQPSFWIPQQKEPITVIPSNWDKKNTLIIAPGGKRNKEAPKDLIWKFPYFPELISQLLSDPKYHIIVVGAEYDLSDGKTLQPHPNLINLIGKTNIIELFHIVKNHASVVMSNNSGLLHIANACDVPTISFANTFDNLDRWSAYPRNPFHITLQEQNNKKIQPNDFLKALENLKNKELTNPKSV